MLLRWGNRNRTGIKAAKCNVNYLILATISTSLRDDYDWPRHEGLIAAQPEESPGKLWGFHTNVCTK